LLNILINIIFINTVISQNLHYRNVKYKRNGKVQDAHNLNKRNVETDSEESDVKYIMGKGEIIVGVETNKPPMTYIDDDGELTGFDTEFTLAVCSKLGIDVVFREIDWSLKDKELNSKNIDCVWNSMTLTEERRKYFEFSRVYINNRQAVVIRRADASKYPDAQSLSSAKMTAGLSTTGEEALLADPYLSQSDYAPSPSQNDAINALKDGQYDAIVIDYTLAKGIIPNDNSEFMVVDGIRLQEEQYAVGFRHGSDMPKRINDIFLDMIMDGTLSALAEKYNLFDLFEPLIIADAGYIMSNGKMIIGIHGNMPPMSYYNEENQLIGFDVEFAKTVCQQLGINAEFNNIFWDKKLTELKQRNIDCIWNTITYNDERRNNMKYSRVYMQNKQVVVIKKSDASKYNNLESLSEANLSAEKGSIGEETIETNSYLSESSYTASTSIDNAIQDLRNEIYDALIIDYIVAKNKIANGNSDLMIVEDITFNDDLYAIGFRGGSDMTEKVNEIINYMINDGTLESLAKKYNILDFYTSAIKPDETSDLNYIMSKGEMIIGIENNAPPMSYYSENGELIGFNIEFAKAICSKLGVDAKFKIVDWDKMETELNEKNIDCLWNSLAITDNRRKNIEFTHAYLNNKQVVVIRKSDTSKFTDIESLYGAKMSAGKETTGEEVLQAEPYHSNIKYNASPSPNDAIISLKNEIFDAIVMDYTKAKGYIANGNSDLMIVEGISLQEEQYAVGFRLGSDILKKVNNLILDMTMDDSLATIATKYDLVDLFASIRTTDAGYIMGKGKMIIGFDGDMPPMTIYDGKDELSGFDIELSREICKGLGIEPEYKLIEWAEKENDLKERNIDCIWNSLTVTSERRKNMKFSRVYMGNKQVVMIKRSSASDFTDLKSLAQAKLSAEISTTGEEAILSSTFLSQASYIPSSTSDNAIKGLRNGEFDAIVIDYTNAIGHTNKDNSEFMILTDMDTEEELYAVGFRVNSDMTININKMLNKIINDGTAESIAKKYNLLELYNSLIKINDQSDFNYIMSKGEMVVGYIGQDLPPMAFFDEYGELTGFDTEFAKAVCSILGIDVEFKVIDWNKKEMELNNKTIDCVWSSLTVTEERRNYFEFSMNYLSNRQVVVIRKSEASKYPNIKSFSGIKMSAGVSTTGEYLILNDPDLSKSDYFPSHNPKDAIEALKNGQCDAIVIDYTMAKGVADSNDSDLMVVKKIKLQDEKYAVGFRLGSDMASKVNEIILNMILDDSITTLAKKYNLVDLFKPIKITDADYIINNGKMIIGFDSSFAPMAYYNNDQLMGFDVDFAKAVCQKLGITAEFKEIKWSNKEQELKERNIDCIWSALSITEERREQIKFSRVYMNNKQVVVIRKSNIFKYADLESLSHEKLSSSIGSLGEEAVMTFFPQASYRGFYSVKEMFVALQKTTIDAVVIDYTLAKDNIKNGFNDLFIVGNINLIEDQYAVGFRYGSDMTKKINIIINNMMEDGTLNAIASKYDLLNLYTNKKETEYIGVIIFLMALYAVLIVIL